MVKKIIELPDDTHHINVYAYQDMGESERIWQSLYLKPSDMPSLPHIDTVTVPSDIYNELIKQRLDSTDVLEFLETLPEFVVDWAGNTGNTNALSSWYLGYTNIKEEAKFKLFLLQRNVNEYLRVVDENGAYVWSLTSAYNATEFTQDELDMLQPKFPELNLDEFYKEFG